MDSNKDEAVRCVRIAEEAFSSGNKQRALKFIRIAQRLNKDLLVSELLERYEKIDSESPINSGNTRESETRTVPVVSRNGSDKSFTEEHAQLIRRIKINKDYYKVLGVEKTCSVEEIRKAYRKLSLKVHPDKNKAPGSEEAFKKVSKAFKCLSEEDSRRQYDQTGLVEGFEHNQQQNNNVRRRRRRTGHDIFNDEFDPDEIFRAFFGQGNVFRSSHVYRAQPRENSNASDGMNFMIILQVLPFLIILLLAYLPSSEPEYSLHKNYVHQVPRETGKHGIEFFVKSALFDDKFPQGSPTRSAIEDSVLKDYRSMLYRYCQVEIQRRHWNRNMPTPHCEKLRNLGVA